MSQSETSQNGLTRRETVAATGAVATGSLLSVNRVSATSSGHIELSANATVPQWTAAHITVNNDNSEETVVMTGDDSPGIDNVPLTEMDDNSGTFYATVELFSNDDQDETPEFHSLDLDVPESDDPTETDPDTLDELVDNVMVFIAGCVAATGAIGLASRSMAVASFGAYLMFATIAMETDIATLDSILIVTLVLVTVGFAMKLWRLEGTGGT